MLIGKSLSSSHFLDKEAFWEDSLDNIKIFLRLEKNKKRKLQCICYALIKGHEEVAIEAIKLWPTLNLEKKYEGMTVLQYALAYDRREVADYLVEEKNVSVQSTGYKPIVSAIQRGHAYQVALLIAYGAEINTKDEYGQSLIEIAFQSGREDLFYFLSLCGADVSEKDMMGRDYLSRAVCQQREEMISVCLKLKKFESKSAHEWADRYKFDMSKIQELDDKGYEFGQMGDLCISQRQPKQAQKSEKSRLFKKHRAHEGTALLDPYHEKRRFLSLFCCMKKRENTPGETANTSKDFSKNKKKSKAFG